MASAAFVRDRLLSQSPLRSPEGKILARTRKNMNQIGSSATVKATEGPLENTTSVATGNRHRSRRNGFDKIV